MIYECSFLMPRIHFRKFYSVHKVLSSSQQGILTQTPTCAQPPVLLHVPLTCTYVCTHKHRFMAFANPQAGQIAVTADIARQRRVISSTAEWANEDKAWLSSPLLLSPLFTFFFLLLWSHFIVSSSLLEKGAIHSPTCTFLWSSVLPTV